MRASVIGVGDQQGERPCAVVGRSCHPRVAHVTPPAADLVNGSRAMPAIEVEVGLAIVFFVPVERFERP